MEMEMEMELPTEIASNILSRLPFDSVIQFKCLSKYWYNLFQRLIHSSGELYFALNHRSRLMENYTFLRYSYTSQLILDNVTDYYFSDSSSEYDIHEYPCSSFSPSSLPDSVLLMLDQSTTLDTNHEHLLLHYAEYYEDQKGWFNCKAVKKLNCPLPLDMIIHSNFWTMSTSSNGLVCSLVHNTTTTTNSSSYLFCIYNPVLGEYVTLPDDNNQISSCTMAFGFSHVPSTDEYKVVRIVYPNTPGDGCGDVGNIEIYTLGAGGGKWRSKGNIKRRLQCDTPGVLVNGSLHWLTEEDERYKKLKQQQKVHLITDEQDDEFMQRIMVFNLLEEEFDHMIRPPVFHTNFRIKEWGGYLCGFNYRDELRMHYTWKFFMYGRLSKNKMFVDGEWKDIFSTRWSGEGLVEPYEELFFYNKANQALLWTNYISKTKRKSYKSDSLVVAVEMHDWRGARFAEKDLNAAKLFHGIFHIKSFVSLEALGENNTKRIIDDDMKRKQDNNNKDEIMITCTAAEETIV